MERKGHGKTIMGVDAECWRLLKSWRAWAVALTGAAGLLLLMAEHGGVGAAWAKAFFASKAAGCALLWVALRLAQRWGRSGKLPRGGEGA